MDRLEPRDAADLCEIVATAAGSGGNLEIRGGGSKSAIGAPRSATVIDMAAFAGIVDYDPAELVLTVRAGTPLAQVEALVASEQQMLAFEPFDHGPIFGEIATGLTHDPDGRRVEAFARQHPEHRLVRHS